MKAEMPPSAKPSAIAYSGAVMPDHWRRNVLASASTKPTIKPPHMNGAMAAKAPATSPAAASVSKRCQVQPPVTTASRSSRPVLATVPLSVMRSPSANRPWKVLSRSTGLLERMDSLSLVGAARTRRCPMLARRRPAERARLARPVQFRQEHRDQAHQRQERAQAVDVLDPVHVPAADGPDHGVRSEEHTSELQSRRDLVCRLLLEKKKKR